VKLVALVVAIAACNRAHDDRPAPQPPPPSPPPPTTAGCTLAPIPSHHPAARRLVAIGDLHGDLGGMRAALRAAGAIASPTDVGRAAPPEAARSTIASDDHWVGGDLVVVQTGDVLDRGDDEQAMLDMIARLEREARAAGGELIMLVGNHELMNAAGDFRYVTPGGFKDFEDVPGLQLDSAVPAKVRARVAALGPGGPYAKQLAQHDVVMIVGDTAFSHAGILGDWVHHLDDTNAAARCWLDGQAAEPPVVLHAEDGPVWTRDVGKDDVDCAQVAAALAGLGAKRMVVGHTVQTHVNARCDDTLWRIDVGLAKEYGGPIEVLQIDPEPKVLTGTR
jgi:hypothetical protein